MTTNERILELKHNESNIDRTAFKVLFAIAFSKAPITPSQLARRVGLSENAVATSLKGLIMDRIVSEIDGKFFWAQENPNELAAILKERRAHQLNLYGLNGKDAK